MTTKTNFPTKEYSQFFLKLSAQPSELERLMGHELSEQEKDVFQTLLDKFGGSIGKYKTYLNQQMHGTSLSEALNGISNELRILKSYENIFDQYAQKQ